MKKELTLSFLLACAVVAGALWALNRFWQSGVQQNENAIANALQAAKSQPSTQLSQPAPSDREPRVVAQEDQSGPAGIVKCILNGKTIYSDEKCPARAKAQSVQLHDTAGMVSPPKVVLAELTAQRIAAENAQYSALQQPVALPVQSTKADCDALDKRIEWLDSMSRQPQPASMQDWIRQDRAKVRDKQFAIHC